MKLSKFHIVSIAAAVAILFCVCFACAGVCSWWLPVALLAAYKLTLVAGSIFIRLNFYLVSKNKLGSGERFANDRNKVALTFDDGPAAYTAGILDVLKKENVAATFFLIGKNIKGHELLVKRMKDEGHLIGNHSYSHGFNFDWKSCAALRQEIADTNRAIGSITGVPPTLFRPPYGVTTPNLARAIRQSNMRSIGWSLRSMDTIAREKRHLLHKILSSVKDGDIILLHDRCSVTADIMPDLIRELKRRNYDFVLPHS